VSTNAYIISLALAIVSAVAAVFLQRQWPHRVWAARLTCLALGIVSVIAFRSTLTHWPPIPTSAEALETEPWEAFGWPFLIMCVAWPMLRELTQRRPAVQLWTALFVASWPLLSALTVAERYADLLAGNAMWSSVVLLAVGANWLAAERLDNTGAGHWSTWVYVAQMFTVAALYMTCYGTVGQWCSTVALTLGVLASGRLFTTHGEWSSTLTLPATTLSCVLLMHVRDYSTLALPYGLAPLPLLSPVIVCGIDQALGKQLAPKLRIVLAALSAAALAVVTISITLSLSGSSEEW
jgi:hypothetical protein